MIIKLRNNAFLELQVKMEQQTYHFMMHSRAIGPQIITEKARFPIIYYGTLSLHLAQKTTHFC